jgi:hypothetical protein
LITLTAKSLKCTVVLEPAEVASLSAPPGHPRVPITIQVAGRKLSAHLNAKSVRKCLVTISEAGPDNCVAVLQGKLAGDVVEDAGLAIQIKAPKPEAATPG